MKKGSQPISWLVMVGMVFNVGAPGPVAFAQGGPSGTQQGIFPGADPAPFNAAALANKVQQTFLACQVMPMVERATETNNILRFGGGLVSASKKGAKFGNVANNMAGAVGLKQGDCFAAFHESKSIESLLTLENCNYSCNPPQEDASGCDDFYGPLGASRSYRSSAILEGDKKIKEAKDRMQLYVAFQSFKMNSCSNEQERELKMFQSVYECQRNALKDAVTQASSLLQMALNQHKVAFEKMSVANRELYQQWNDMNVLLGANDQEDLADPLFGVGDKNKSNQFGGLLGIQATLEQDLDEHATKSANHQKTLDAINQKVKTNEEGLERARMVQIANCFNPDEKSLGSGGGRVYRCNGPAKPDANGRMVSVPVSCGPMEYLKNRLEQSAYVTNQGNVVMGGGRKEKSAEITEDFVNLSNKLREVMSPPQVEGEVIAPGASEWSKIRESIAGDAMSLSQKSRINVMDEIEKIAGSCFRGGDIWRRNQINSASSRFGKERAAIKQERDTLNGELQKELRAVSKNFSDAMAVLGGGAVGVRLDQCPKNDSKKMLDCFNQIRSDTSELLNGKPGRNFNLTAGAARFSCSGIRSCITVVKKGRDTKKAQVKEGMKIQAKFAVDARNTVDTQLNLFSSTLKGLQSMVENNFGMMAKAAGALGVEAQNSPNRVQGEEMLQAMAPGGSNQKPPPPEGPYQAPKNMSQLLSGKMQPGGMIDFSNDGMGQVISGAMQKISEKKKDLKEELDQFKSTRKDLDELAEKCRNKGNPENVGNGACDERTCSKKQLAACKDGHNKGQEIDQVLNYIDEEKRGGSFKDVIAALDGFDCPDSSVLDVCYACAKTKKEQNREEKLLEIQSKSSNTNEEKK